MYEELGKFLHGYSLDSYKIFGAHKEGDEVVFRVYAPCAKEVEIKGSFNNYQPYKMVKISASGVYEIRLKDVKEYDSYFYNILTRDNRWIEKCDPYAFLMEKRPAHNSRYFDVDNYPWHDEKWMKKRTKNFDEPMNIYEMHIGSFVKIEGEEFIDYERLAPILCKYLKEHNYTHVEFMPILEHPIDESWGYQVSGFYSVTSRYGNPKQLMYLIDYLHQNNIGAIMDFVCVHFASDSYGLLDFDGTQVYGYDNDLRYSQWGSPNFDLGRNPVKSYLMSCVSYFLEYFHFDGIRFDAVSNMIYYDGNSDRGVIDGAMVFIKRMNSMIKERYPNVMLIAEDSTSFPNVCGEVKDGCLGFDYKWDLGWMNDTLKYFEMDPIYRKDWHNLITFSMHYYFSERFLLPLSHDEVVHGKKSIINKMWGSYEDKFKQARLLYAYMYTHPGKKLSFMGNEIGQFIEWDYKRELDWFLLDNYPIHKQFNDYMKELYKIYAKERALSKGDYTDKGFGWMMVDNKRQSVFTYYRRYNKEYIVVVLNMTPVAYEKYEIGVPEYGYYTEILNSDDVRWGGNTIPSSDYYITKKKEMHGQKFTMNIKLPPFGAIIFRRMKDV